MDRVNENSSVYLTLLTLTVTSRRVDLRPLVHLVGVEQSNNSLTMMTEPRAEKKAKEKEKVRIISQTT
jgi:hypothetical protein